MPGADIRDVPEASGTQREDWSHMEPLNGAQPKWNRAGRPSGVPDELRGLEAEATGGRAGQDVEEPGAPAPPLPLQWHNLQEAKGVTPPRREVQGHGGLRAPGSRLPPRGTRVAPQTRCFGYSKFWRISGLSLDKCGRRGSHLLC